MKPNLRTLTLQMTIALSLVAFAGCAPKRGDLKGKVMYQGKAVCSGFVNVEGGDKMITGGQIQPDGSYEVKNLVVGQITVSVFSPDPGSAKVLTRNPDEAPPPAKDRSKWFPIPEEYNDFSKSGLSFSLKPGPNTIDIELK